MQIARSLVRAFSWVAVTLVPWLAFSAFAGATDPFVSGVDRVRIIVAASHSSIGCGIGFELALLLPPIMWLRQRRRGIAS